MISLKTLHRASASRASHYYADQKDDYYHSDDSAAQWQGKAATALGLTGTVSQKEFLRALRGDFGEEIKLSRSVRLDAKARAALDMTFSPPKSVSIQALIGRDGGVINAHDRAVTKALTFIEDELVRVRQKVGGVTTAERTGNAAIAKFRHETARPTKGSYSDPQLHTHAVLMNLTQRADGSWVAISNDDVYRLKALAESVYHSELASELEKAGHTIRYEGKNFELAHISREQLAGLSKRAGDVNVELAAMGLDRQSASRALKQTITLKTRQSKTPEIDRQTLQQDWERQAQQLGIDFAPGKSMGKPRSRTPAAKAMVADECLKWAIKHHTERESVMEGKDMLKTALHRSTGSGIELADIKAAVQRSLNKGHLILGTLQYQRAGDRESPAFTRSEWVKQSIETGTSKSKAEASFRGYVARGEIIPTGSRYTTQIAREREKRILQIEREGREAVAPIMTSEKAQAALAQRGLKPGQLAAAELILCSTHRFVGVQGLAGTGKSHMLAQVKETAAAAGYTVKAVASYGKQIEALRELNMEARTVASVLATRKTDRFTLDDKTVLVIDEAGVVPTRVMERLMQMAETSGARVVMLGDTGQTKAIEAGKPFHQLQTEGMATALMGDIIRQTVPELKEAVELAAKGQASASLGVLSEKLNAVHSIDSDQVRYDTIAERYAALNPHERRATLIVTGTNASRNALNDATRQALGLAGKGFDCNLLTRRDTTQAERRVAKYYVAGDIIQPERSYKAGDLRQGEMYRVIGVVADKDNVLMVEHVGSKVQTAFNPARAAKLSVYQPVMAELAAGDVVRVTRNNAALDLVNGGRYEVLGVTPISVTIHDGRRRVTLEASTCPLHLDRAYATTSHSSQGLTCDRAFINAESFSRTTQRDVYYVGISRARQTTEVFTNCLGKLIGQVDRHEEKTASLDIVGARSKSPYENVQKASN